MRPEHEVTLPKPTKDMLMGSMGVVRPILPKGMVANLRHQSIANMNETKGSMLTWQDPHPHGTQIFLGCFWKLWVMDSRTQFDKCINYLPGKAEHRGAWSFSEMLLTPFFPCVCVIHEIPLPEPFTTTPLLAWLIFHLHCFVLCHSLHFFLASCASTNFLQNKALASTVLVLCMCPRCQIMDTWCIVGHYMLIKLKNLPLIKFRC
jgi:hypothetical protein